MNRIRQLREERKISMKTAADLLNMPYTTYVNYEKGLREPNSETLIDLANFYNCSIDYLIGRSSDRIDDRVLDIVNEIDDNILQNAGDIKTALEMQNKKSPAPEGTEDEERAIDVFEEELRSVLLKHGLLQTGDITPDQNTFLKHIFALIFAYFKKGI